MKIKFHFTAFWNVRTFAEDLASFNGLCIDHNVVTSTPLTVTPDDDPGQGYAWLAQVSCDCEAELEELEMDEFYDAVEELTSDFFELSLSDCSLKPLKGEGSERYLLLEC